MRLSLNPETAWSGFTIWMGLNSATWTGLAPAALAAGANEASAISARAKRTRVLMGPPDCRASHDWHPVHGPQGRAVRDASAGCGPGQRISRRPARMRSGRVDTNGDARPHDPLG